MYERLEQNKGHQPPFYEKVLKLEFKPLLTHLRYTFLGNHDTLSFIMNTDLSDEKLEKLL